MLMKDERPRVQCKNKPLVTALREIAASKVMFDRDTATVVDEWVAEQRLAYLRSRGKA